MQKSLLSIKHLKRNKSGNVTAELPVVIWVFFFVFLLPLIDFTSAFIRITLCYAATHNACILATKARTFETPLNGDPTAMDLATSGANQIAQAFSGVHINSILTEIITTNIDTQKQTISTVPLTTPPDVGNNTYQIQITTSTSADPLLVLPLPGKIPGLTTALNIQFSDRQYFENPQGLVY